MISFNKSHNKQHHSLSRASHLRPDQLYHSTSRTTSSTAHCPERPISDLTNDIIQQVAQQAAPLTVYYVPSQT
ncbi:hypothetical protein RRG08_011678 [Elysia crispata]|uniref:Uncharacterized protein n=1 Tax=Elysia crispata TaxID=231223 RepID=A0AAE1DLE7_9GAST|nr:hypothetical protein RRG08_011678 [Elysia crispata]